MAHRWCIRLQHTCEGESLREAALDKLASLKSKAKPGVGISHTQQKGLDLVQVKWLGKEITIAVVFQRGQTLVMIEVPGLLAAFKSMVIGRVQQEVREVVHTAGGQLLSFTDENGQAIA